MLSSVSDQWTQPYWTLGLRQARGWQTPMGGVPPPAPQVAASRAALLAGLILLILMVSAAIATATAPIDPFCFFISKEHFPGQSCCSPHVSDLPTHPQNRSPQQGFGTWDLTTRSFPAGHVWQPACLPVRGRRCQCTFSTRATSLRTFCLSHPICHRVWMCTVGLCLALFPQKHWFLWH